MVKSGEEAMIPADIHDEPAEDGKQEGNIYAKFLQCLVPKTNCRVLRDKDIKFQHTHSSLHPTRLYHSVFNIFLYASETAFMGNKSSTAAKSMVCGWQRSGRSTGVRE